MAFRYKALNSLCELEPKQGGIPLCLNALHYDKIAKEYHEVWPAFTDLPVSSDWDRWIEAGTLHEIFVKDLPNDLSPTDDESWSDDRAKINAYQVYQSFGNSEASETRHTSQVFFRGTMRSKYFSQPFDTSWTPVGWILCAIKNPPDYVEGADPLQLRLASMLYDRFDSLDLDAARAVSEMMTHLISSEFRCKWESISPVRNILWDLYDGSCYDDSVIISDVNQKLMLAGVDTLRR